MKTRELDYLELKEAYKRLKHDTSLLYKVNLYHEIFKLREENEKLRKLYAFQKRKLREANLLLLAKLDEMEGGKE